MILHQHTKNELHITNIKGRIMVETREEKNARELRKEQVTLIKQMVFFASSIIALAVLTYLTYIQ